MLIVIQVVTEESFVIEHLFISNEQRACDKIGTQKELISVNFISEMSKNDAKSVVSGLLTLDTNSQELKHQQICIISSSSSSVKSLNNVVSQQHLQGFKINVVNPLDHNNYICNNITTNIVTNNLQQRLSNTNLQQQHDKR